MAQIHAAREGLPKPAIHFVEALRHSYGYAARASSRGMTGLGKQNGFHLNLKGSMALFVRKPGFASCAAFGESLKGTGRLDGWSGCSAAR